MKDHRKRANLTCKLSSPELQQRKKTVISQLKSRVRERKEGNNEVLYKFESTEADIQLVINFIQTERLCCDFFGFKMEIEPHSDFLWLTLSGPEGVKEFIKEEIGF